MNVQGLYRHLLEQSRLVPGSRLEIDPAYLDSLHGQLRTTAVADNVCSHFPAGRIHLEQLLRVSPPGDAASDAIEIEGMCGEPPFSGMRVRIEVDVIDSNDGGPELRVVMFAFASAAAQDWTLAGSFRSYENAVLSKLRFQSPLDPELPLLRLSSHEQPGRMLLPAMSFLGQLDLDSLPGPLHALFRGPQPKQLTPIGGLLVATAPPAGQTFASQPWPQITFAAELPKANRRSVMDLIELENIALSITGGSEYNFATRQLEHLSAISWVADLAFAGWPADRRIPVGVTVDPGHGHARLVSDPSRVLSLSFEQLRGLIPGMQLQVPGNTGYELTGSVGLTKLTAGLDLSPGASPSIEWIGFDIATSEDNRWVLIERVLTLDAIDLQFFIRRPGSAHASIELALTGWIGLGKRGLLRLTTTFEADAGSTDYSFRGQLTDDSVVDIREIIQQFAGTSAPHDLPALGVRNLYFSVWPRQRRFEGSITLFGEWPLPGSNTAKVLLESLHFDVKRSGDGDTRFTARGAFQLGETSIFVAADYRSDKHSWTFEGGTAHDTRIPVGTLLTDALQLLGAPDKAVLPAAISGLSLGDVNVRFDTATRDFSLRGTAAFPIDGDPGHPSNAELRVHVELEHRPDGMGRNISFGGALLLQQRHFDLSFDSRDGVDLLVAAYGKSSGDKVDLHDLVAQLSAASARWVPSGISIELAQAQLVFAQSAAGAKRFLFGIDLGAGVDISKLPLVGRSFERGQTLTVSLQIVVANESFSHDEIARINRLTAPETTKLAAAGIDVTASKLQVRPSLKLGAQTFPLSLPLQWKDPDAGFSVSAAAPVAGVPAPAASSLQWFNVQRAFGPFHFERAGIGLSPDGKNLELLFDASFSLAGLELSLAGLGAALPLAQLSKGDLQPKFHLDGLGVDLQKGKLTIAGALLRRPDGSAYDGSVAIHYDRLGIVGVGSYAEIAGQPALFMYALVDYPIGGPPVFFVEGVALGFGYNRSFVLPELDGVARFPLIAMAQAGAQAVTPRQMADALSVSIKLTEGEYFVAVGVRFTSFRLVTGTLLLALVFGRRFEIDLLGIATLISPSPSVGRPALMRADLALRARYVPDDGVLSIRAELMPDAYLFAPDCHVTGGFAFSSWSKTGDFVLTLGGYHSGFRPPPHYPTVPRLGLSWQVNANLSIKADAYFALTPAAFMAGGHLRANYISGDLHAWFNAGIDCLVAWQPYQYDAQASISVGATYRTWLHTFSVELSARLDIWGPPFSGIARVSWYVFSFDVEFGGPRPQPATIGWAEFRNGFLPNTLLTVAAQAGKVAQHGQMAQATPANQHSDLGMVNARELRISVHSAVPITGGQVLLTQLETKAAIGIPAMGRRSLSSTIKIDIRRGVKTVNDEFSVVTTEQSVPTALWGRERPAKPNDASLTSAWADFSIVARAPPPLDPKRTTTVPKSTSSTTALHIAAARRANVAIEAAGSPDAMTVRVRDSLQRPDVRARRKQVLAGLLPETELDCDFTAATVAQWREAPEFVRYT